MSISSLVLNTLIPQTLRVLAEALQHIADLFEAATLEERTRENISAIHPAPTSPTSTATIAPEYCEHCTHGQRRHTFDPSTRHCYFHLTRRELQERNLDRHTQVPRH